MQRVKRQQSIGKSMVGIAYWALILVDQNMDKISMFICWFASVYFMGHLLAAIQQGRIPLP